MRTSEPKPHQINRFASVLSIPKFEMWLRKMMRTSESGHWLASMSRNSRGIRAPNVKHPPRHACRRQDGSEPGNHPDAAYDDERRRDCKARHAIHRDLVQDAGFVGSGPVAGNEHGWHF